MKVKRIILTLILIPLIIMLIYFVDYTKNTYYYQGKFYSEKCAFMPSPDELYFMEYIEYKDECLGYEDVEIYCYLDWMMAKTSDNGYILLERKSFENPFEIIFAKGIFKPDKNPTTEFCAPYYLVFENSLYKCEMKTASEDIINRMYYVGYIMSNVSATRVPEKNFESNMYIDGHILYQCDEYLVCSWDGGEEYITFKLDDDD